MITILAAWYDRRQIIKTTKRVLRSILTTPLLLLLLPPPLHSPPPPSLPDDRISYISLYLDGVSLIRTILTAFRHELE